MPVALWRPWLWTILCALGSWALAGWLWCAIVRFILDDVFPHEAATLAHAIVHSTWLKLVLVAPAIVTATMIRLTRKRTKQRPGWWLAAHVACGGLIGGSTQLSGLLITLPFVLVGAILEGGHPIGWVLLPILLGVPYCLAGLLMSLLAWLAGMSTALLDRFGDRFVPSQERAVRNAGRPSELPDGQRSRRP
jgi:hypothetical protein